MKTWIQEAEEEIKRKESYFHMMTTIAKKEIETVLVEARANGLKVSEASEGVLSTFSYDPPSNGNLLVKRISGRTQAEYRDWGYSWNVELDKTKFTRIELRLFVQTDGELGISTNGANVKAMLKNWLTLVI